MGKTSALNFMKTTVEQSYLNPGSITLTQPSLATPCPNFILANPAAAQEKFCFGRVPTPYDTSCLVALREEAIAFVSFHPQHSPISDMQLIATRLKLSSEHVLVECQEKVNELCHNMFMPSFNPKSLLIALTGSDFQIKVWQMLSHLPYAKLTSYGLLAAAVGQPRASRAVGTALANNSVAWFIPCHRVIRNDGKLGGYYWGMEYKKKMLQWEQQQHNGA